MSSPSSALFFRRARALVNRPDTRALSVSLFLFFPRVRGLLAFAPKDLHGGERISALQTDYADQDRESYKAKASNIAPRPKGWKPTKSNTQMPPVAGKVSRAPWTGGRARPTDASTSLFFRSAGL